MTLLAYRLLVRRWRVVPRSRSARPYAMFGFARVAELRWRLLQRRRPVLSPEEYARRVTVADIEELLGCQLCGERRVQPLLSPSRPPRWAYHVVRCPSCGFMYRNPGIKPERLGELYGKGNYGRFLTGRYARKRKRGYRQIMGEFSPLLDKGGGRRLLDYGSGAGLFLQVAHRRGFEGYGVDLAPDAVALARERPGSARSYVGMPLDVPEIAAGGFDVVTLWSVLAHLPRPVEDLRMLRELLTPDGVLIISTVNANSLLLKAYHTGWGGFTPNHLVFFSPTTMPELLRQAGFGAVVFRPMYAIPTTGPGRLTARQRQRLRRSVDRGNQGRMLRAAAFVDPDGPARHGLGPDARRLL